MSVLRAVELIKAAAEAVSGYTFETGTAGLNNIQADKISAPMVVLDRPLRINKTVAAGGGINESYQVSIGIFDLSDLAYTYAEHEPIIFTADQAANQIIVNLNSFSEYVKALTDIQVNDVINALDVNVSGVFMQFTLELYPEAIQPCPDGTFVPEGLPPFKTFLTDAPSDGNQYARQDNEWVQVNGNGVTDLQGAYDGGNVVNGITVVYDGTGRIIGAGEEVLDGGNSSEINAFGFQAAAGSESNNANAFGFQAALNSVCDNLNAFGNSAAAESTGNELNAFGASAAENNTGSNVNAFGSRAGRNNQTDDCNFFGTDAGSGNATAFGVTVFSPQSIPSYYNRQQATLSITTANGAVAGQVYIYRNESNHHIEFIVP